MVEHDNNTVRTISWSEVFPWLNILRVFGLAISARALVLGAVGILLTMMGWTVIEAIFGDNMPCVSGPDSSSQCPWKTLTDVVPDRPALLPPNRNSIDACPQSGMFTGIARPLDNPISVPFWWLTLPAWEGLYRTGFSIRAVASIFLSGLWSVAVWAFFGAAICRIAAVQLAVGEQVGLGAAVRFSVRKWPSYAVSPLLPIGGVLLATIPILVLGWIMRVDAGLLLGGIVWPLTLAAGFLMTLLLLGVLFGWPLMWATISTEGTDSFDALSRTYAYTFQRPLHYLFYACVAGAIGWLGWLLVENFAAGVIWMGYWAAGWGGGAERVDSIMAGSEEIAGIGYAGMMLVRFWTECVKLLAVGYLFSYFWSAAAAIYLLLRHDVDATEMDEVHLDADDSEQTYDLPKVTTDPAGAPVVENDSPENASEPSGEV